MRNVDCVFFCVQKFYMQVLIKKKLEIIFMQLFECRQQSLYANLGCSGSVMRMQRGCTRNASLLTPIRPGWVGYFSKGRNSWKYLSSGRRLALAGHCSVRLVLILLLMGRQVFSKASEKRYHRTPAETLRALVK